MPYNNTYVSFIHSYHRIPIRGILLMQRDFGWCLIWNWNIFVNVGLKSPERIAVGYMSKDDHDFTCGCSSHLWWWTFPVACDLHIELILSSWQEWRHDVWSISSRDRVPGASICYSVIYWCFIDSVRLSSWPWHCHTCLSDVSDSYWWRDVGIYRKHISHVFWPQFLTREPS